MIGKTVLFYFLVLECGWVSLQNINLGRIHLLKKVHVFDSRLFKFLGQIGNLPKMF